MWLTGGVAGVVRVGGGGGMDGSRGWMVEMGRVLFRLYNLNIGYLCCCVH